MHKRDSRASILIAEDEKDFRNFVIEALGEEHYSITEYIPGITGPEVLQKNYDVAILDVLMPGQDGFELRKEILKYSSDTQFIIITGQPDVEKLNKSIEAGSFTFLTKPFGAKQIRYSVAGALRMKEMYRQNTGNDAFIDPERIGLVGNSPCIRSVRSQILKLAPLEISVLITGESGTGKDIVADCLHRYSRRAAKPFVAVNCANLTPTLIESELFGHVQGAFTGATKTKYGLFEAANGGTIFLDEIGDLPVDLQSKLLRVLDKGEIRRVGDTGTRRIDARVISATNRNLGKMAEEGLFRQDLFYRLRGAQVEISPLRERKEDIPALIHHFLGDRKYVVTPAVMEILQRLEWPGNVRELLMLVATLKGICVNRVISEETINAVLHLNVKDVSLKKEILRYHEFRERVEKDYFGALIKHTNGNISAASRLAGVHRKNLRDKLRLLGMYSPDLEYSK